MEWLVKNWYIILALIIVITYLIMLFIEFSKKPKAVQIANLMEWLKWAVTKAESKLGSGTGQLKLRMVYNMAVDKFPFLINTITFELFSLWVDDALVWMRKQLEDNKTIEELVNGGELGE